jgi:iron-sulfur cluster repair protein YtfE (RIC family)
MKATDLLKKQHEEVSALFKRIERAHGRDKTKLFDQLAANLVAHDAIEREIFYPACEKRMGMTDELGEAIAEHGLVEFGLHRADSARGEDSFDYQLSVLKEIVEHHVEEEEEEFFPKVERALGAGRLEELGEQMEERFEAAMEEDFRRPLHENLRQVLAGAMKTRPLPKKKSATGGAKSRKTKTATRRAARRRV